jgi:hypothetical protein
MLDPVLRKTEKSRVKRLHEYGSYDREVAYGILDAAKLCHVAYVIDGEPYCTPTIHWREGDMIYWHGSSASRMLRKSVNNKVCLTVTHLDGFVMARSAFNHSLNYRSVMLFGEATVVPDDQKAEKLKNMVDILYPGRWVNLREMKAQEVKATTILGMPIDEGSAKVTAGPPEDEDDDYELNIWAGVIPVTPQLGEIEPCPRLNEGVETPDHIFDFIKNFTNK